MVLLACGSLESAPRVRVPSPGAAAQKRIVIKYRRAYSSRAKLKARRITPTAAPRPEPKPLPLPVPRPFTDGSEFEREVLALINDERRRGAVCGHERFGAAAPLRMEGRLKRAADAHSDDMVSRSFFGHQNPSGESPFDRIARAGYRYRTAGENVAAGQRSPQQVVQAWMDSPGHCRNIMNASFTETGIGHTRATDIYGHYWTQTFGTARS
jgi:uncharacterized protein YkwD